MPVRVDHGGVLLELGSNVEAFLAVAIGTVGTIWAIGFATYYFIFNYLDKWVERELLKKPEERLPMNVISRRLDRNRYVFVGYLLSGFLSVVTIIVASYTLAFARDTGVVVAGTLFVATLVAFLVLFSFEVWTSLDYVEDRRTRLLPQRT